MSNKFNIIINSYAKLDSVVVIVTSNKYDLKYVSLLIKTMLRFWIYRHKTIKYYSVLSLFRPSALDHVTQNCIAWISNFFVCWKYAAA